MTKEEWIERIRAAAGLPESRVGELLRFDRVIDMVTLDEASRIALEVSAGELPCRRLPGVVGWRSVAGRWVGVLPLPEDWLRFVRLRLYGWSFSVDRICFPGDEDYWRRWSAFPEIAGSPEKPRIYLAGDSTSGYLEIHSGSSAEDSLSDGVYIPRPSWSDGLLPDSLAPTLILRAAEKISRLLSPR